MCIDLTKFVRSTSKGNKMFNLHSNLSCNVLTTNNAKTFNPSQSSPAFNPKFVSRLDQKSYVPCHRYHGNWPSIASVSAHNNHFIVACWRGPRFLRGGSRRSPLVSQGITVDVIAWLPVVMIHIAVPSQTCYWSCLRLHSNLLLVYGSTFFRSVTQRFRTFESNFNRAAFIG